MTKRKLKWLHDPVLFRRLNGWLVVFWMVMFPVSVLLGLINDVAYVAVLSVYANLATHWGGWAAARSDPDS